MQVRVPNQSDNESCNATRSTCDVCKRSIQEEKRPERMYRECRRGADKTVQFRLKFARATHKLEVGSVRLATTRFLEVAVADVPFPHRGWYVETTCTAFGRNRRGSNVWSGQIPFRLADLPPATQPSLILTADLTQKFPSLSLRSVHLPGETGDPATERISIRGCCPYRHSRGPRRILLEEETRTTG